MKTTNRGNRIDAHSHLLFTIVKGIDQDREFDLHTLARAMYMSRYTLHRYSVQIAGLSPGRLILRVRLKKAQQLLAQKELNISDIAFETGFNSVSHFSTEFKKHFGICPHKWSLTHVESRLLLPHTNPIPALPSFHS